MHRTLILDLLKEYSPMAKDEKNYKDEIILFIQENQDCFERTNIAGHITSSAWILNKTGNKALLTHHAKLNDWFQLGGHCDGNIDVLEVALNEAREESGIKEIKPLINEIFDIDIHLIPTNGKETSHYHYDIRFLLQVKSDEVIKKNNESKELLWIDKYHKNLPTNKKSIIRMFNKWLSYIPKSV